MADNTVTNHQRACDAFAAVTEQVKDWGAQSPCTEWDARAVVEHVIGFHEVLVLRPLGAKVDRPKDDAPARWRATQKVLIEAIGKPGALDEETDMGGGNMIKLGPLVSTLTTDVLVHTWDLAKAAGVDPQLDGELCELGYERASKSRDQFAKSDMFENEVAVPDGADVCSKLLGIMGRDPGWKPPG
jgi:uncharacterized protein (TIGR03086 family)